MKENTLQKLIIIMIDNTLSHKSNSRNNVAGSSVFDLFLNKKFWSDFHESQNSQEKRPTSPTVLLESLFSSFFF